MVKLYQHIFSIKNKRNHKIIRLLGFKIKYKLKNKYQPEKFFELESMQFIKDNYPQDYVILSRDGVGDNFFLAGLCKEFKKQHSGKIVIIVLQKKLIDYLKSFPSIDEVIYEPKFKVIQNKGILQREIQKGKLNLIAYPYRGEKPNYVFADSYANLLNLPLDTKYELPVISSKNISIAEAEINKLIINPSKTILLIPEATMFNYKFLPPEFWKQFAKKIINQGYDVVFNSNNPEYTEFKMTFLPIMDFLALAKQIKYIISFRSGINDLLVGMNITNLTAIYPKHLEVLWADNYIMENLYNRYHEKLFKSEFENIFHIYSLNSNFRRNDISEVIFNYDCDELEAKLLSILDNI